MWFVNHLSTTDLSGIIYSGPWMLRPTTWSPQPPPPLQVRGCRYLWKARSRCGSSYLLLNLPMQLLFPVASAGPGQLGRYEGSQRNSKYSVDTQFQSELLWFVWFEINAIAAPFISNSPVRLLTFSSKDKLDYITYLYYVHCISS